MGINIITFYWSIKGIFYLHAINKSSSECVTHGFKVQMVMEIIVGFMLSVGILIIVLISLCG